MDEPTIMNSKSFHQLGNLFILKRLQKTMDDKPSIFQKRAVHNMHQLLTKINVPAEKIPFIISGNMGLRGHHKKYLERLFDGKWEDRLELEVKIRKLKSNIAGLDNQRLTKVSAKEFRERLDLVKEMNLSLEVMERTYQGLPNKNTLPTNLYEHPTTTYLAQRGLLKSVPWPDQGDRIKHHVFTEKGQNLVEAMGQVLLLVQDKRSRKEGMGEEENLAVWSRLQTQMKEGVVMSFFDAILRRKN